MSNKPVYVVANFQINDKDEYRKYEKGFFQILKKHEGTFYTYDDNTQTFEGAAPRTGRVVIFGFPTAQAAKDWYSDPDYQALSEHRRAGTSLEFITMVNGLPVR